MTEANQGRNGPRSRFTEPRPSSVQLEQERLWEESTQEETGRSTQPLVGRSGAARRQKGSVLDQVLLIVEDEADDFVLLNRALRKSGGGAVVRWVQTADQAL